MAFVDVFSALVSRNSMTIARHQKYVEKTKSELIEEILRLNREIVLLKKRLAIYKSVK